MVVAGSSAVPLFFSGDCHQAYASVPDPVPQWLQFLDFLDAGAMLQVGAPLLYASDLAILAGVLFFLAVVS